jgi:hypothetical protein
VSPALLQDRNRSIRTLDVTDDGGLPGKVLADASLLVVLNQPHDSLLKKLLLLRWLLLHDLDHLQGGRRKWLNRKHGLPNLLVLLLLKMNYFGLLVIWRGQSNHRLLLLLLVVDSNDLLRNVVVDLEGDGLGFNGVLLASDLICDRRRRRQVSFLNDDTRFVLKL